MIEEMEEVRKYVNKRKSEIGRMYKMVSGGITKEWMETRNWKEYVRMKIGTGIEESEL